MTNLVLIPLDKTHYRSEDGRFRVWCRGDGMWVASDAHNQRRTVHHSYASAAQEAEGWLNPPVDTAKEDLTVTNAARDYDYTGFGTREIEVLGEDKNGKVVRVVATPKNRTQAQRMRYASGLNMAVDPDEFEMIRDLTLVEKV